MVSGTLKIKNLFVYIYLLLNDLHASSASLYLMPSQFLFICWRSSIFFLRLYISLTIYRVACYQRPHFIIIGTGLKMWCLVFFFSQSCSELSPLARERDFSPFHFFFSSGEVEILGNRNTGATQSLHDQIKHPFIIIFNWLVFTDHWLDFNSKIMVFKTGFRF